jgi:hypothetical protein
MRFICTLTHRADGTWLARHAGSTLGKVEVAATTREEALAKLRAELHYRSEYCPCTGVADDFVELQVQEEGARP